MVKLWQDLTARRMVLPIAGALAAALFASFVCQVGIPALRHDWEWPRSRELAWPWLIDSAQGWTRRGLGGERPYPSDYLIDMGLAVAISVCGPLGGLFVVAWIIGAIVFGAAVALVRDGSRAANPILPISAGLFALFNPWTYNEVVAGHQLMVLANGALGFVVAGLRDRSRARLTPLLLAFHQLQVFLIALLLTLQRFTKLQRWRVAVLILVIAPIAVGIALDRQTLFGIPRLVVWEREQAVVPIDALLLRGYYVGYSHVTEPWSSIGAGFTALLAATGLWLGRSRREARGAFAGIALIVAFIGSLASPIGPIVGRLYEAIPALSLYRESYDLVGLLVVGYLTLWRWAAFAWTARIIGALAATSCLIGWFVDSPAHWWVPASELPQIVLHVPKETRVAFYPPFQPLSFDDRGAGADPDELVSGGFALNEYLPQYPGDAALALFAQTGATENLAALSVAQVVCRPWFSTSPLSVARMVSGPSEARCRDVRLHAEPELELVGGAPPIVSVGARLGAHAILFADANVGPHLIDFPHERSSGDARDEWIDATLAYPARPQIAQPFGGRYTVSERALGLPRAEAGLVAALRGTLIDADGRILTASPSLAWKPLYGTPSVRCHGECVVAALADGRPSFPPEASARHGTAVSFHRPLSWLVTATLPPHRRATLLVWNERYSPRWGLYGGLSSHVRIDGVVNGWILPPNDAKQRIVLMHSTSALQALLELVAFGAIAASVVAIACRSRPP